MISSPNQARKISKHKLGLKNLSGLLRFSFNNFSLLSINKTTDWQIVAQ